MRHTHFWAAVSGSHLEIVQLMAPFSNVAGEETEGLTPLAETSRKGYHRIIRYLLRLPTVTVNTINVVWDNGTGSYGTKTPLDLRKRVNTQGVWRY